MQKVRKVFTVILVCSLMLFTTACKKGDTPFKHGTVSGSTYTSEFLGIKVQAGSGWTMLSDADLAKSNGISDMSESSIQSVFDKGVYIAEMMMSKKDGVSINFTVQDNDKSLSFSEKEYFTTGVELIKAQSDAQGFGSDVKKSSVNFLGKSTNCIELSLTMSGTTIHQIQIPIFKSHYTASLTFNSLNKSELQSLVDMVTAA